MPEVNESSGKIRFGEFEADLSSRELRKNGIRIRLPGLPFSLLEILLEHAGEVVQRDQLCSQLWPDAHVDFDRNLNLNMNKLREALRDSAEKPRYIETLPRVGYRFIAPVEAASNGQKLERDQKGTAHGWPRNRIAGIVGPVLILLAVLFSDIIHRPARLAASKENSDDVGPLYAPGRFNDTKIPGGSYIWFSSIVQSQAMSPKPVTISLTRSIVRFLVGGELYYLRVPDATVSFSPECHAASTRFDPSRGRWVTKVPSNQSGDVFLTGMTFHVPSSGLPESIHPVVWFASLATDDPKISLRWRWSADLYSKLSSEYDRLMIKSTNDGEAHVGTPNNFKNFALFPDGHASLSEPDDNSRLLIGAREGPKAVAAFAYAANYDSRDISAYAIDSRDGALSPIAGSPYATKARPYYVIVDPSESFVYVANRGISDRGCGDGCNVSAYRVDHDTGTLAEISGSPFKAGFGPTGMAQDQAGRFLYVTNVISNDVSGYARDMLTGALVEIPGSPFSAGYHPFWITVDNGGKFVYVANQDDATISAFRIDPRDGSLAQISGSPFDTGLRPRCIVIHPSGKFAYVINYGVRTDVCQGTYGKGVGAGCTVSAYTIDQNTGALRSLAEPARAGTNSIGAAIDPQGRYLYVTNLVSNDISAFKINSSTGRLAETTGSPYATENGPVGITIDPSGKYILVTGFSSGKVSSYKIDPETGALEVDRARSIAAGKSPQSIVSIGMTLLSEPSSERP